jgi:hypothetical protein
MVEERCIQVSFLGGGHESVRDHLGDPGVDGRIVLKWNFRKRNVRVWIESSWIRLGTGGGHL